MADTQALPQSTKGYSFRTTLFKGLKAFGCFGVPVVFDHFAAVYPYWWNLPIGSALVMAFNWWKNRN